MYGWVQAPFTIFRVLVLVNERNLFEDSIALCVLGASENVIFCIPLKRTSQDLVQSACLFSLPAAQCDIAISEDPNEHAMSIDPT